jgi:hypothetical protein
MSGEARSFRRCFHSPIAACCSLPKRTTLPLNQSTSKRPPRPRSVYMDKCHFCRPPIVEDRVVVRISLVERGDLTDLGEPAFGSARGRGSDRRRPRMAAR